ncbi:hypothetical protein HDV00_001046 [Rhizophlyctis rosea]|nr:hypothetical protein HDV00_001046 [Rhizophlyctis rosea]
MSATTLPIELYPFVAKVCHPLAAQRLRNATRGTRKIITNDDLLIAEAGWRYCTKGLENCWNWAVRKGHWEIVEKYLSEVPNLSYASLGLAVRVAGRQQQTDLPGTLIDFIPIETTTSRPTLAVKAKVVRHLMTRP